MRRYIKLRDYLYSIRYLSLFVFFFCLVSLHSPLPLLSSTQNSIEKQQEAIQKELNRFTTDPLLSEASVGLAIKDLQTGKMAAEFQSQKLFIPASVQKIFTWGAALKFLGPDYKFTTSLYFDQTSLTKNGELNGSLVLKGDGDPVFSRINLKKMVSALYSLGVRKIKGSIVITSSLQPDEKQWGNGWAWDDLPYSYSAPSAGISLDENKVTITISPGDSIGSPAAIQLPPYLSFHPLSGPPILTIENKVVTGVIDNKEDISFLYKLPNPTLLISGTIPVNSLPIQEDIAVLTPETFIKAVFIEILAEKDITFIDTTTSQLQLSEEERVITHNSIPLKYIGRTLISESDNFIAEMLLKKIGDQQLDSFLTQAGITKDKYRIVDGSGMSRYNLTSPLIVTDFLAAMLESPINEEFLAAFPGPGEGTLAKRFSQIKNPVSLWGKTGAMTGISNLAGYLGSGSTPKFAFAIFINHSLRSQTELKQLEDDFITRIAPLLLQSNH